MQVIVSLVLNKMNGYHQAMRFAFRLAFACIISVLLGIMLDKWLHTTPLFLIVLLAYATIGNLYLLVKECSEDE